MIPMAFAVLALAAPTTDPAPTTTVPVDEPAEAVTVVVTPGRGTQSTIPPREHDGVCYVYATATDPSYVLQPGEYLLTGDRPADGSTEGHALGCWAPQRVETVDTFDPARDDSTGSTPTTAGSSSRSADGTWQPSAVNAGGGGGLYVNPGGYELLPPLALALLGLAALGLLGAWRRGRG